MISGDNEVTARAVARMVGIHDTNVIAGVLPHEKVRFKFLQVLNIKLTFISFKAEKIRWLQSVGMKKELPRWRRHLGAKRLNERCIVAFVGDGINDAPVRSVVPLRFSVKQTH